MIKTVRLLVVIMSLSIFPSLASTTSAALIKTETVSNLVWSDGTVMSGYITVLVGQTGPAAVQAFNYIISNGQSLSFVSPVDTVSAYSSLGGGIYEAHLTTSDTWYDMFFRVNATTGEPQSGVHTVGTEITYDSWGSWQTVSNPGTYHSYLGVYDAATMSPFGGGGGGGPVATPEPGTMMLLGSGVLTFGLSRFRRRKPEVIA